jgi:hypothetical protein
MGAAITLGRTESGFRLPFPRKLGSCCLPTQTRTIVIPPSLQSLSNTSHCHTTQSRDKVTGGTITHARKALDYNDISHVMVGAERFNSVTVKNDIAEIT